MKIDFSRKKAVRIPTCSLRVNQLKNKSKKNKKNIY